MRSISKEVSYGRRAILPNAIGPPDWPSRLAGTMLHSTSSTYFWVAYITDSGIAAGVANCPWRQSLAEATKTFGPGRRLTLICDNAIAQNHQSVGAFSAEARWGAESVGLPFVVHYSARWWPSHFNFAYRREALCILRKRGRVLQLSSTAI